MMPMSPAAACGRPLATMLLRASLAATRVVAIESWGNSETHTHRRFMIWVRCAAFWMSKFVLQSEPSISASELSCAACRSMATLAASRLFSLSAYHSVSLMQMLKTMSMSDPLANLRFSMYARSSNASASGYWKNWPT